MGVALRVTAALLGVALWSCRPASALAECGDAVLDAAESCDLGIGNEVGVACTTRCQPPRCGDGHLDVGEPCDDGNLIDGDGARRRRWPGRAPCFSARPPRGQTRPA